jgi:hypothetical protein
LQAHTASGLANELRQAAAANPEAFSAGAAKFGCLRPLFIRHLLDGLRQSTVQGAKVDWLQCLELVNCTLERSAIPLASSETIPGDDPDWSWAVRSAAEWLAFGLRRGANGVPFVHADIVRMLVVDLYRRVARLLVTNEDARVDRRYTYFAALQTVRGATVDLCVLLLYWESKNPASLIGKAPQDALARAPDILAIFETELQGRSASSWIPRAVLDRYLTWLYFFGENWLRSQMTNLFPSDNKELCDAAWLGHLRNDQGPVGKLVSVLHPCYNEHITTLGRDNAPPGYEESKHRLIEYLMILYLYEELPEILLQQFWIRPLRTSAGTPCGSWGCTWLPPTISELGQCPTGISGSNRQCKRPIPNHIAKSSASSVRFFFGT